MIDIKILREHPEIVAKALHDKAVKVDLEYVQSLDQKRLILWKEVENLRARRNSLSALVWKGKPDPSILEEAKTLKEHLQEKEKAFDAVEAEFLILFKKIPNIPTDDTPVGLTEEENVVVKTWGKIRDFTFQPRTHAEIGTARDWIDKERAANIAGARFAYLKGDIVRLHYALVNWAMDILGDEGNLKKIAQEYWLTISPKPFTPILPPLMIKTAPYDAMDRLEPREERYKIEWEDLWLQVSAEHVLGAMHANEIFTESDMPVRYVGFATSFRGEAGTYGKDMEGIIRMHQFDKLEMESFSLAENSHEEYLFMSAIQEYLMQQLNLPYQKLQKCTFDIGKPNAKWSDIEVWFPWQGKYRETHTADYMTDYQARRLQTRVRREGWNIELVHTNDATALSQRPLIAIIENYQNEDMTVTIPEVLRPYMGGREKI